MVYHIVTQDRERAVLPPCKNCGSNVRFRFEKDYYSKGKLFCACEKQSFVVGGIRSREGVDIPGDAIQAVRDKMEGYGFRDVSIIAPDKEKIYNYPSGYRMIIKSSGHVSPEVYLEMLNNKKPERTFVATYEYGSVIMEHAPFSQWENRTWNWVERPQRANKDLTTALYHYLVKNMSGGEASDFHANKWNKQVIYKEENYETEQARKKQNALDTAKYAHRQNVNAYLRRIREHEEGIVSCRKLFEEAKIQFEEEWKEAL